MSRAAAGAGLMAGRATYHTLRDTDIFPAEIFNTCNKYPLCKFLHPESFFLVEPDGFDVLEAEPISAGPDTD